MGKPIANRVLSAACEYAEKFGFSVIPIGPDKIPLIKWAEYQQRRATLEEIRSWWTKWPDAMIGLVTGKQSGLLVIDCDTPEGHAKVEELLSETIITPIARTPRGGWHYYFQYPEEGNPTIAAGIVDGVDMRGEGGYIVAPPSCNGSGKGYTWVDELDLGQVRPAAIPSSIINFLIYKPRVVTENSWATDNHNDHKRPQFFTQGRRDEDLFHAANLMTKGGGEPPFVNKSLKLLALGCSPPFDLSEVPAKIESATKRAERRERNIASEVKEWTLATNGHFTNADCHRELQLTGPDHKKAANMAFLRLVAEGFIEKYGTKRGCYRVVERDIDELDFTSAPTDLFPINLPFGLSELANLYPKNILVFAGAKDSSKTATALDLAKRNIGTYPILYMTSEMGDTELRKRLEAHADMTLERWKKGMTAVYRAHGWADLVTHERKLFIIDYVEPPEDKLYEIGTILRSIHEKLDDGVAVVFIQKKYGEDLGRGGQFTLDKARLYVALDGGNAKKPNRAKIISCKSFRGQNPRGLVLDFKVHQGWDIQPVGYWKEVT